MYFESDDKLKAYLKKESKRLGVSVGNTYNTFFSRLLLERISNFCYDKLCVKGSFSELCYLNKLTRPVTDVDIVTTEYHNEPLLMIYKAMYDSNDEISFELTKLPYKTKTGIYKINLIASFGKIKHPISIDFQELSHTIYAKELKEVKQIFTIDRPFKIYAPSYEEHLAEKLCIIVESNKQEVLNTRVKDFYDIYHLTNNGYDKDKLSYFFKQMLIDRMKIDINDVTTNFIDEDYIKKHNDMWNNMKAKYEFLDDSINFRDSVYNAKDILSKEIKKIK